MKGGGYFNAGKGVDLYYSSEGPEDGIPVLLLHGWVCDQTDWAFQIPFLLSLGFRVIGMDYRGHGHSSVTDDVAKFDPVTLAEDAVALLAHLGIHGNSGHCSNGVDNNGNGNGNQQQAIVMGHSLGCLVAHLISVRYPNLVRGTVLVDSAYTLTPPVMDHVVQMLEAADPPSQAAVIATDFFGAFGMYSPDHGTPAWLAPSHQRRVWAMQPRVVVETWKQMQAHLGESGAAYMERTRREADSGGRRRQDDS
ncbi:alpha/beta-hydrolase [Apiospora rasikravindrae]|uniref:Alpha/beta-hydrolase n=1 Tax=Apiospora rasikravindrae TaxID=990691 RepID=A0ABR1S3A8_9PEZI